MPDEILRFRMVTTGKQEEIAAEVDEVEFPTGEFLRARAVWLKDGTSGGYELRQHRPPAASGGRKATFGWTTRSSPDGACTRWPSGAGTRRSGPPLRRRRQLRRSLHALRAYRRRAAAARAPSLFDDEVRGIHHWAAERAVLASRGRHRAPRDQPGDSLLGRVVGADHGFQPERAVWHGPDADHRPALGLGFPGVPAGHQLRCRRADR